MMHPRRARDYIPPLRQAHEEFQRAKQIANDILDRPYADPDDDKAILSRQFLRTVSSPAPALATFSDEFHQAKRIAAGTIDDSDANMVVLARQFQRIVSKREVAQATIARLNRENDL